MFPSHPKHKKEPVSGNISTLEISEETQAIATSIMRKILYFEVFNYPLKQEELKQYCDFELNGTHDFDTALQWLLSRNYIHAKRGLYFAGSDISKVESRLRGNALALKRLRTAQRYSKLIAHFPYTRGVYISGSLSKNYMDNDSDIDFFIITKPGRLWINRTLLAFFKRIFLLNSYKNFCINYFIDTDHLELEDKNVYSATEAALLLPMYNHELYLEFLNSNSWYRDYFPNFSPRPGTPPMPASFFRKSLETMLNNRFGDFLEKYFQRLSVWFWKRKYKKMDEELFNQSIISSSSLSRYHPHQQQFRILEAYEENIRNFEDRTGFLIRNG